MKYFLLILFSASSASSCFHQKLATCENEGHVSYIRNENVDSYLFSYNTMPYEGYTEYKHFNFNISDINTADSVMLSNGVDVSKLSFAQYSSFVDDLGNKVLYINYVFDVDRKIVKECEWFFGLGEYFEKHTIQGYVDLNGRRNYEVL